LITITETGKNTAIDEDGNTWTLNGSWNKDYIVKGKIIDGVSMHGIDRENVFFQTYIDGQKLLAQEKLISVLDGKSNFNPENQQRIIYEKLREQQMFDQLVKDSFIFK